MKKNFVSRVGFTLVEMLVAATIAALLAAAGLVSYATTSRNARDARRKADFEQFRSAMELYRVENDEYIDVGSGASDENFESALSILKSAGFITNQELVDPRDSGDYQYTYEYSESGGFSQCPAVKSYEICTFLEKTNEQYCICNP